MLHKTDSSTANWAGPTVEAGPIRVVISTLQQYLKLSKLRIATLIVISTGVGYYFGQTTGFYAGRFLNALIGTALMAAGSAALNQWLERDIDCRMNRTRHRPIPSGTLSATHALIFGIAVSVVGFVELFFWSNPLAAGLSLATLVGYVFLYTPLKRVSPICTTIGAIPGAVPPLIGFAAAAGHLSVEAWILFGILFFWQFPHFHAIAWMYREDYDRGGIKMLAVVNPDALGGRILLTLLCLIPITLAPAWVHMAGSVYFISAIALGLGFLYFGARMARKRTYVDARRLLLASVVYLPLLFAVLVLDKPTTP
ncbi:MAG TPA: heme o synthase [Edaphobacter sp.]|nr:heme o synthase [Edaphobacter sp.]